MPGALGSDPTLGTTSVIGRYFGLVSTIPSVFLVGWIFLILAAGGRKGAPSIDTLVAYSPKPSHLAAAVAIALALAVTIHPAQFAIVQLLEGYWGGSRLAVNLRERMVLRHLARLAHAEALDDAGAELEEALPPVSSGNLSEHVSPHSLKHHPAIARNAVRSQSTHEAAAALTDSYPVEGINVMPTRLGNVLRRHEMLAGASVGLPVLRWATHIGMVAEPSHNAYLNDQRTQMDLAARMTASASAAALTTFALLWDDGASVLLALVPWAVAWVSYRGAVTSANSYGMALRAWTDLNRFALYEKLGLKPVHSVSAEQDQNKALIDLANGSHTFAIDLGERES